MKYEFRFVLAKQNESPFANEACYVCGKLIEKGDYSYLVSYMDENLHKSDVIGKVGYLCADCAKKIFGSLIR